MYWTDTHLHFGEHMENIPSYMEECRNAGVKSVILCAGSEEDALQAKALAGKYPEFFYAVGVHPHEAVERKDFAAFFSRISFKSTDEWKEEIVFLNPDPVLLTAVTPDGKSFEINSPATDPRTVFADWLLEKDNPFFARAFANRAWHWIFGRGLIDPADDMPLPKGFLGKLFSSENGNEKVLDFLAAEFTRSNYDIKKLFCLILNSCAYNADWKTLPAEQTEAEKRFAVYPFRRLEAEVLVDIYSQILGAHES
jgi:hypothetical protein